MQKNFNGSMKAVLALSLLMVLPGCWKQEKDSGIQSLNDGSTPLLTVDGKILITERSFQHYYDNLLASNQNPQLQMMLQLLPNAKEELFKGRSNEKLIGYWAEKEGITQLPEYKEKFEQGIEVLKVGLAAEFLKKEFAADMTVTEDQLRDFYEANKQQFVMSPAKDGKPAQYYSFDQVKQHLEQQLQNEKLTGAFLEKIGQIKETYKVVENTAPLRSVGGAGALPDEMPELPQDAMNDADMAALSEDAVMPDDMATQSM